MKKSLYLCALMLGLSGFVAAQQSTPPASTPPTFPSDSQQAPTPDRPSTGSDNPASQTGSQTSQSTMSDQTVTGCLSENTGTAAGYVLTDNAGQKYELKGDSSDLAKHVGQEVSIKGQLASSGSSSGSMSGSQSQSGTASSSGAAGSAAAATPLTVSSVKKVADTCSNAPAK